MRTAAKKDNVMKHNFQKDMASLSNKIIKSKSYIDMVGLSKRHFYIWLNKHKNGPYNYSFHVPEVARWAEIILKNHPEIDKEIVLISVWLHDIGSYPVTKTDHAVLGEKLAKDFLMKNNYDKEKLPKVLHCIRAHRCRDVKPLTIEAKLVTCCDSASHLMDYVYISILIDARLSKSYQLSKYAFDKLERDYNDLSTFPEIKQKLTPIYLKWKTLLLEYKKID